MLKEKRSNANLNKIGNKHWKAFSRTLEEESTVELVRRIVEESDRLSLRVLLETRRLFHISGEKRPLLLPEFLLKLRNRLAPPGDKTNKNRMIFADCVYDLTMAKYSNFPDPPDSKLNSCDYSFKGTGADCRNHYRDFLREIQRKRDKGEIKRQEEEELYAGKILQNKVYNNFSRSQQDCKRYTPFSIRYTWKFKGTKIILYYPSHLSAKEFRKWLEENIKDVNFRNPFELDRIQSIIDASLPRGYHISTDDPDSPIELDAEMGDESSLSKLKESQVFVYGLGNAVAQKKVKEIHELRPGVAKLGKKAVKRLILEIFSDLSEADYSVTRIADQYGISKPTLSRFAGSKWFEKIEDGKDIEIPDLWKNTAKILAGNPTFMKTVITSGYAGELKNVLDIIKRKKGEVNE